MTSPANVYRYDALDVLTGLSPASSASMQWFYRQQYLVTQLQGTTCQCVVQQGPHRLGVQSDEGSGPTSRLLATDQQESVLQQASPGGVWPQVFTPYGHDRSFPGCLIGFNGERRDPVTGHYLLGNGHRAFNPVLMRFNSPDRLSPFYRGGLNPYAYCLGDPVNLNDPTGRFANIGKFITAFLGLTNARLVLEPAIPYGVAKKALQSGAAGQLPAKYTAGAAGSVIAGVTTMLSAVTGVGSAVAGINNDSEAAAVLGFIALGLGATTVAGRVGSGWVARDPKAIATLKSFGDGAAPRPTSLSFEQPVPSAPLPTPATPGTPMPSAPMLTLGTPVAGTSQLTRFDNAVARFQQEAVQANATKVRRHSVDWAMLRRR